MSNLTDLLMPHLLLAPILLPMLTGGLILLMKEEHRRTKLVLNIASTSLGLVIAVALLMWVKRADASASIGVYLPGNWAAPFGIVLALDRLSAMMLLLGSLLGLASILFAAARWHRAGVHYHPLFQFQLMGLSGPSSRPTCSTCSCSSRSCSRPPTACCCMARAGRGCRAACTTSPSTWRPRRCS